MLLLSRSWMVVMAAGLAVTFAGCQPKTQAKSGEKPAKPHAAAASEADPDEPPALQRVARRGTNLSTSPRSSRRSPSNRRRPPRSLRLP